MLTIEIEIEEGGFTERCIRGICALYPGLTPEAIIEDLVEYSFRQALDDLSLLESYAGGGQERMERKALAERKLWKQFDIARKGRKVRAFHVADEKAAAA